MNLPLSGNLVLAPLRALVFKALLWISTYVRPTFRIRGLDAIQVLTQCPRKLIAIIVYRLTLHPLARYPGPIIGKVTDWYSVYHAFKGDRHLDFYHLHQKYGNRIRGLMNGRLIVSHRQICSIRS